MLLWRDLVIVISFLRVSEAGLAPFWGPQELLNLRDVSETLGPLKPATQAPSDGAHLVELPVEVSCRVTLDVAPVACDVWRRPDFFCGPASRRESSSRIACVIPSTFGDIDDHTLCGPLELIGQRQCQRDTLPACPASTMH